MLIDALLNHFMQQADEQQYILSSYDNDVEMADAEDDEEEVDVALELGEPLTPLFVLLS